MRIGIDAQWAAYPLRGIGRYVVNLVSALAVARPDNEYVIYGPARAFPEISAEENFRFREPPSLPYPVWEQVLLPRWVRQDRLHLLHSPGNTAPLRLPKSLRLVITLHDVIYLLPPTLLPRPPWGRQRLGNLYRRAVVPRAALRADRILAVSEFTRQQAVERLRVDPARIRVTYQGAATLNGAASPGPGADMTYAPFILALGSHDPRKNTERVIRAYAELKLSGQIAEQLRIVGLRRWQSSSFFRLVRKMNLERDVLFEDYVPDAQLATLYASARCLLYPSLYEGFGFPPLEAMRAGIPVVASASSAIPEVAGEAAVYVDPASTESIRNGLLNVLREPHLWRERAAQGRARASRFSWQTTAAQTLAAYHELAEARP